MDFPVSGSGIVGPVEWGTVIDKWGGAEGLAGKGGQPMVVDLEDAHGYYEAQKNAASILGLLESQESALVGGGKKGMLVCVEGASGRVSPEWASVFPDEEVRRDTAESLLERGEVTGEEYLAMVQGPGKMEIWGVEDEEVFQANVKARRMLEKEREKLRARLGELEVKLKKVKGEKY